jgi:hypothetical protein
MNTALNLCDTAAYPVATACLRRLFRLYMRLGTEQERAALAVVYNALAGSPCDDGAMMAASQFLCSNV